MNRHTMVLILAFITLPFMSANAADIPRLINYQGNVKDAVGVPIDGNGYFKFALVNSIGSAYWANDGSTLDGSEPSTAVTIPVTNGLFSAKLGNTGLSNMAPLTDDIFDNSAIYLRVWFSYDSANFELFTPDAQIVSNGFAFKAQMASDADTLDGLDSTELQKRLTGNCLGEVMVGINTDGSVICETDDVGSGGGSQAWSTLTGIPAGFADNVDNVGITTEADPSVPANLKDGLQWADLSDVPTDLADGDDIGITTELDPSVPTNLKDGLQWADLPDVPMGLADGGNADRLDGFDSTSFSKDNHGHSHNDLTGLTPSDHHSKTISFTELADTISDGQLPSSIARDNELTWANLNNIPASFADNVDDVDGGNAATVGGIAPSTITDNTSNIAGHETRVSQLESLTAFFFGGDGSAGNLNITTNVSWLDSPPTNPSFGNITINSGQTLTVPAGTTIRCSGNFINNGTLAVLPNENGGLYQLISNQVQPVRKSPHSGDAILSAGSPTGSLAFDNTLGNTFMRGGSAGIGIPQAKAVTSYNQFQYGGGGGSSDHNQADAGSGGGLVKIKCNGSITNNGSIVANALSSTANDSGGGGGGGIVVLASLMNVSNNVTAIISANGSDGGHSGWNNGAAGGGGGGIIILTAPIINNSGSTLVAGGAAGTASIIIDEIDSSGGGAGGASGGNGGAGGNVSGNGTSGPAENGAAGYVIETRAMPFLN